MNPSTPREATNAQALQRLRGDARNEVASSVAAPNTTDLDPTESQIWRTYLTDRAFGVYVEVDGELIRLHIRDTILDAKTIVTKVGSRYRTIVIADIHRMFAQRVAKKQ
jgi:hypothetical protein